MAKKITKKINSRFIPTIINGIPVYKCGGKLKRYDVGGALPYTPIDPKLNLASTGANVVGQGITDISNAYRPSKPNYGANIGGGALSGAATGAAIGSIVPGIGTVIGGAIGGIGGALKGLTGSISKSASIKDQEKQMLAQQNQNMKQNLMQNVPSTPNYTPTFANGGAVPRASRGFMGISRDLNHRLGVPLAVNQLIHDLMGREGAINEKSLNEEELEVLRNIVKKNLKKGKKVIEYADYETGKNPYADVGGVGGSNQDMLSKITDPAYNLKTTLGQAAIKVTPTDTIVSDRYNFNNRVKDPSIKKYIQSIPKQGKSIYRQMRNLAKYFGSGPGEGSVVDIRFSKDDLKKVKKEVPRITKEGLRKLNVLKNNVELPTKSDVLRVVTPMYNNGKNVIRNAVTNGYSKFNKANGGYIENSMYGVELPITDRLTEFKNGGTHEESPYGGIPLGNNALAEEGEFMYTNKKGKKYIFTNRF